MVSDHCVVGQRVSQYTRPDGHCPTSKADSRLCAYLPFLSSLVRLVCIPTFPFEYSLVATAIGQHNYHDVWWRMGLHASRNEAHHDIQW